MQPFVPMSDEAVAPRAKARRLGAGPRSGKLRREGGPVRCRSITRRIRRVPDSGGKPNPADRYWRRIEHCSGGRLSCQSRLPQAVLIFMKRVLVERLGRIRTQRKSSTVYFVCASCRSRSRIRSITSGSLSSIEASSVRASRVAFKSSSSFA